MYIKFAHSRKLRGITCTLENTENFRDQVTVGNLGY